jgi:hypothetical protein
MKVDMRVTPTVWNAFRDSNVAAVLLLILEYTGIKAQDRFRWRVNDPGSIKGGGLLDCLTDPLLPRGTSAHGVYYYFFLPLHS